MNARHHLSLGVLLLVSMHGRGTAQATAPSGALSPAAPANPTPTASGNNTGVPPSKPGGEAQQPSTLPQTPSADAPGAVPGTAPTAADLSAQVPAGSSTAPSGPPITLEEAIRRARTSDHTYVSAVADKGTADAQRTIVRSAVLPNIAYHNQFIYTQPQRPYSVSIGTNVAGGSPPPIFIANNTVHEYVSQGVVTETIGVGLVAETQRAYAEAAAAKAKLEIARRGLVSAVVGAYYGLLAAEEKAHVAARALDEANRFGQISGQLEAGGEVAHADTLKAGLQQAQRQRDYEDAMLAAEKARLDLGVLLFPDPTTNYTLASDLEHPPTLATREELAATAKNASPDVRAALATLRAAQLGVTASISGFLPDLSLAYNYGIDAPQFAIHDRDGIRNLGYSATATFDIPVWDWFATAAKVKQSRLARDLAKADLTVAQRRLIAAFQEFYGEAEVSSRQLASLTRSVTDSREALRLTTMRYSNGEGTVLEVVDAQNTVVTAESARADGVVRYYTALANLQTMTGNMP